MLARVKSAAALSPVPGLLQAVAGAVFGAGSGTAA